MADIHIHLRVSPPLFRWGFAAALLSLMSVELASENVTLTTYYPAPSGIYTKMITTQDSFLSRDSGRVGIGVTNPNYKLEISGEASGATRIGFEATGSISQIRATNILAVTSDRFRVDSTGRAAMSHLGTIAAPAANSIGLSVAGGIASGPSQGCVEKEFIPGVGGAAEECAANHYATMMAGFWSETTMFEQEIIGGLAKAGGAANPDDPPMGKMLCCPCNGTCP